MLNYFFLPLDSNLNSNPDEKKTILNKLFLHLYEYNKQLNLKINKPS